MRPPPELRIVPPPCGGAAPDPARPARGDLALIATLFALNVVPIASDFAAIGRWSEATVGFAVGAALLSGRELWAELREHARARSR